MARRRAAVVAGGGALAAALAACHGEARDRRAAPPVEQRDARATVDGAALPATLGPVARVAARFAADCPGPRPAETLPDQVDGPLRRQAEEGWTCITPEPTRAGNHSLHLAIDPGRAEVEHVDVAHAWSSGPPPPACVGLADIAAAYVADLRQLTAGERRYLAAVIARRLDRPEAFVVTLRDQPVYFAPELGRDGEPPSCAVTIGATRPIAWARPGAPLVVDDPR